MTHVKICGLTNLVDASVALAAGADLLGFNFYCPSPRYIAPETAAQIISTLRAEFPPRSFRCVGVFVNSPLKEVKQIQVQCGLDLIQLHGDESVAYGHALRPHAFKALRLQSADEAERWIEEFSTSPPTPLLQSRVASALCADAAHARGVHDTGQGEGRPTFLLDASHPNLYGGTGVIGDWHIARSIAQQFPVLLAGGLNAANVADAIRSVRPWGVDVASGVERAPGIKDAVKVERFIEIVKRET